MPIFFSILVFISLIMAAVFHYLKVLAHWDYLKATEGKFKNHSSYWQTAFSFDFSEFGSTISLLLPFFSRSRNEAENETFKTLGNKVSKRILGLWLSFVGAFVFLILMGVAFAFSSNNHPGDIYLSVEELKAVNFVDDQEKKCYDEPDGLSSHRNADGDIYEQVEFKNGCFHGYYKEFYPNGNLKRKQPFEHGILIGPTEVFYEGGQKLLISQHQNGKLHGKRLIFFQNGQVWEESNFENGRPKGSYKIFNEDGELEKSGVIR